MHASMRNAVTVGTTHKANAFSLCIIHPPRGGLNLYGEATVERALGLTHKNAFSNGVIGSGLGLFATTGGGTVAISTASLTADDVIKLVYALKHPYRNNAKFIMNDQTIASIRQLRDNNSAYIW